MITLTLLKNHLVQLAVVATVSLGFGAYLHKRLAPPPTTTTTVHDVQQVYVDKPIITEKIVDRIISDPVQQATIKKVTQENAALNLKITQLSSTVASNQSSGGTGTNQSSHDPLAGTITTDPVVQSEPHSGGTTSPVYSYKDWQLSANFLGDGSKFSYGLQQTFIIESTQGTDSNGKAIGLTRLFQESPNGLLPIPAKTTVIQAEPNPSRWFISPRIQGGLGVDQDKAVSGFVGLQLLKHGTSKDPKDLAFAVGTVGVSITSDKVVKPLLLPISFNLGHLPKQPFSNIWLSPGVDLNHKVSILLTATF